MKYINRQYKYNNLNKRIVALLIFSMMFSLLGCGTLEVSLPFFSDESDFNGDILTTTEKLDSFASNLCVVGQEGVNVAAVNMDEIGAAALFNADSNEVIYAKNPHTKLDPASLTKVMTALVALKYGELDSQIVINEPIVFTQNGATTIDLEVGDKLTLDQALHLLLIKSANDVAIAIARHISGSVEEFCNLMNSEVVKLGATNTNFVNPNGLTDDNHYTTAYDMYLMFQEALSYAKFNDIIAMDSYSAVLIDKDGNNFEVSCSTTNLFLKDEFNAPDNIIVLGGKTGTTNNAGHCLIIHSKDSNDSSYFSIILKAKSRDEIYLKMIELLELI